MSVDQGQTATAERMSRARGRIDSRGRTLKVDRPADRIVPVFEMMRRRDQLTAEQAQAGETFAGFWHGARRVTGLVGAYGDQRWSGTTAGQGSSESLIREEWPVYCAQKLHEARASIGDGQMYDTLERVVVLDATLEDIGREFLGYKAAPAAMAAGAAIIKMALHRLSNHYGYTRQKVPRGVDL